MHRTAPHNSFASPNVGNTMTEKPDLWYLTVNGEFLFFLSLNLSYLIAHIQLNNSVLSCVVFLMNIVYLMTLFKQWWINRWCCHIVQNLFSRPVGQMQVKSSEKSYLSWYVVLQKMTKMVWWHTKYWTSWIWPYSDDVPVDIMDLALSAT